MHNLLVVSCRDRCHFCILGTNQSMKGHSGYPFRSIDLARLVHCVLTLSRRRPAPKQALTSFTITRHWPRGTAAVMRSNSISASARVKRGSGAGAGDSSRGVKNGRLATPTGLFGETLLLRCCGFCLLISLSSSLSFYQRNGQNLTLWLARCWCCARWGWGNAKVAASAVG